MHKLSKMLCVCLAFYFVFAILLTGCSSSSESQDNNSQVTSGTTEQSEPKEKIKVKLATCWTGSDANAPALQQLVKKFNEENNEIEIIDESIGGDGYNSKIKVAVGTGDLPHIFQVWGEAVDYAKNGLLLDIKPYFDEDTDWSGGFTPGLIDVCGQYPGLPGRYVVPMENNFEVFYYNTELFEKAGITKAPETFDELLDAVQKLNAAGIVPIGAGVKDSWRLQHIFNGLMHKNVGVQKSYDFGTGKSKFTDPEIVETIAMVKTLVDAGAFDKNFAGIDYQSEQTSFFGEKSAMVFNGTWFNGSVADSEIKDKIRTFLMPEINPQYKDNDILYSSGFAVSNLIKNDAERDAAITVIKYLSGAEATDTFTQIVKRPPIRTDIKSDVSSIDPLLAAILEQQKSIKTGGKDIYDYTYKAKMVDVVRNGLVAVGLGIKSPEEIANEWQAEMEKDN